MKKLFYTMSALLLLASCTDDYKDWTAPQQIIQPAVTTFGDGSIAALPAAVDLNDIPAGQDSVQVCTVTAPTTTDASYAPVYIINFGDASFELDEQGRMAVADLQQYVADKFGRNPNITRTLTATVEMWMKDGDTSVKMATSDSFEVKAVAEAPFIDPNGYYIVGNVDGWACKKVDAWHLVNNGGDVYENPVFSYLLAPIDGIETYEIKFIPASAFNGDGTIGNWDIALSALKDVDEVAYEGRFSHSNAGGNIKFDAKAGANFYNITLNLLDATYKVEPVSYAKFIYEIGNSHGWSQSMPLYGANDDGKYQGYYYLNGGFKFKPNADNWDGDWGQDPNGATGTLVQEGEQDCQAEAGFYQIDVDLAAMTYRITAVNSISIIGTVNGNWNNDTDMTYNTTTGAWEVTATLDAGAMKFRMNHDWTISWGGANGDATAYDNLTQNNGKDLDLTEAGTYKIELFITYEGNNKVVITKL
jgi:hypothetical protein